MGEHGGNMLQQPMRQFNLGAVWQRVAASVIYQHQAAFILSQRLTGNIGRD